MKTSCQILVSLDLFHDLSEEQLGAVVESTRCVLFNHLPSQLVPYKIGVDRISAELFPQGRIVNKVYVEDFPQSVGKEESDEVSRV